MITPIDVYVPVVRLGDNDFIATRCIDGKFSALCLEKKSDMVVMTKTQLRAIIADAFGAGQLHMVEKENYVTQNHPDLFTYIKSIIQ